MDIPHGFRPIGELRTSPFLEHVGPFYFRRQERNLVLGLRVGETHANARGTAHGGLLMTMADVALGYQLALAQDPPLPAGAAHFLALAPTLDARDPTYFFLAGPAMVQRTRILSLDRPRGKPSYSPLR